MKPHDELPKPIREDAAAPSTETGEQLEQIDTDWHDDLASSGHSGAQIEELADCLRLIDRVREHNPDWLADFPPSDSLHSSWMDGGNEFPAQIGRFRIRRKLGQGGFGLVFLAFDPELEREVALKVPRIEALVTEQTRQRFLREGKAAGSLNHINIGAVYESGRIGPICYIASAYCSGGSLADLLGAVDLTLLGQPPDSDIGQANNRSADKLRCPVRPSAAAAASLMLALADAVQHAHSRDILHRDLKPANILFATTPRSPEELAAAARIVDFGLARSLESSEGQTATGVLLGTPSYMSPEQAVGDRESIGPSCDVYSLGAVFYELLTGRPPIKKSTDAETIVAVRYEDPTPPGRLNRDLPKDLEAICLKCLEKDSRRRYQSCYDLASDLRSWIDGKPVTARPLTTLQRSLRWCRRRPAVAALVGTIGLATVALATTSSVAYFKVAQRAEAEKRERIRREINFERAKDAVDALLTRVAVHTLVDQPRMEGVRRQLLEAALAFYQDISTDRGNDPEIRLETAQAHGRLGEIYLLLDRYDDAERALSASVKMLEELTRLWPDRVELAADLAQRYEDLARVHWRSDGAKDLTEAERMIRLAMRLQPKAGAAGAGGGVLTAGRYLHWSQILRSANRYQEAKQRCEQAVELLEPRQNADPEVEAKVLLVNAYDLRGTLELHRPGDAETCFKMAVELGEQLLLEDPSDLRTRIGLASACVHYSDRLSKMERFAEAERPVRRAVELLQSLIPDFPETPQFRRRLALSQLNLGTVLRGKKLSADAERFYREAIDTLEKLTAMVPEQMHYQLRLIECRVELALTQAQLNQLEEGCLLLDSACLDFETVLTRAPSDVETSTRASHVLMRMADASLRLQRFDDYEAYLVRSLETVMAIRDRSPDDPVHWHLEARIRSALGLLYQRSGRLAKAQPHLTDAYDLSEKVVLEFPEHAYYLRNLARASANAALVPSARRDYDTAMELYDRALAIVARCETLLPHYTDVEMVATVHYNRGGIYLETGRPEKALESYEASIDSLKGMNPQQREAPRNRYLLTVQWGNLARVLSQLGKLDEALEAHVKELALIERLVAENPEDPMYQTSLAVACGHQAFALATHPDPTRRNPAKSVELAERAVASGQPQWWQWRNLGIAHYRAGNWTDSSDALTRARELDSGPGDPLTSCFLAMCYHQSGEASKAEKWLASAIESAKRYQNPLLERCCSEAKDLISGRLR